MFTQELPAWRKKQRRQTASFQGKYRVEKSGGNLAHIRSHTLPPTAHTASQPPESPTHFQWNFNAYRALETKGAATSNTQWSTVGRRVGNAREGRREEGGERRGGPWGAGWGIPGRGVGRTVGNPGEEGGERPRSRAGRTAEPPKDLRRVAPNHHSDRFRSFRNAHQSHQPHTGQLHPQLACTFVRLWGYGWEDVRDGCAAFLVFRAGSARTLKQ